MTTTKNDDTPLQAFVRAFALAQQEMENAAKDAVNPHFRSKYATLEAVREATLGALNKHGFIVLQRITVDGNGQRSVNTKLMHVGGYQEEAWYPIPEGTPQQVGSAITYARRYSWSAICGIAAEEDDDANEAQGMKPKSAYQGRKDGMYPILEREIRAIESLSGLQAWWKERQDDIRALPPQWIALMEEEKDRKKLELIDLQEQSA